MEGITATAIYKIFQLALGLATTYFIAHSLSKESYGQYNYILTVIGVISFLALPGLDNAVSQSVARGHLGTYIKSLPISLICSGIAAIILSGFAAYYFYLEGDSTLMYAFLLAAAMFPLLYGFGKWKSYLLGQENFKGLVKIASYNTALKSATMIALAILFPDNMILILLAYLAIPSLQNIHQTFKAWRETKDNKEVEEGSIAYGLKSSAYSIIGIIATNIDNLLVFHFLSPAALASYAAAQRLPDVIKGGIQDLGQILLPKFSRNKHLTKNIDRFFTYIGLAIGGGIVLVTFTIFPFFFSLIFGEQYEDALVYAQALMCSLAVANAAPLKVWFMNSKLDSKTNRDLTLIISIARIVASLILVPFFGIWGAVASSFLHRLVTSVSIHLLMRKRYPVIG